MIFLIQSFWSSFDSTFLQHPKNQNQNHIFLILY
jgi:hypothetical protein